MLIVTDLVSLKHYVYTEVMSQDDKLVLNKTTPHFYTNV